MASIGYLWKSRAKFPIASVNYIRARVKRLFTLPELIKRNNRRIKLIRNGAFIHKTAEIGEIIISGTKKYFIVGAHNFIGKAVIALHHKVSIGAYVCINDRVQIMTASHNLLDPEWKHIKKEVIIDDYAWIAGNPGKPISKKRCEELNYNPCEFLAANSI